MNYKIRFKHNAYGYVSHGYMNFKTMAELHARIIELKDDFELKKAEYHLRSFKNDVKLGELKSQEFNL